MGITKEEAIKRLKEARNTIQPFLYVDEAIDYAIKALEQQPSKDCISRQTVNELVDELARAISDERCCITTRGRGTATIMQDILNLPSVTPQQTRWIPVSERLPEEGISVIGTTKFNDIYETELYDDCGEKKWYADGNYDVPIVAWLPLPEPYRESEDVCKDCYYNDGEVHAECVICNKTESGE
jgi:hypothetical protein